MDSTRRDFLHRSAAAATIAVLGPASPAGSAGQLTAGETVAQQPNGPRAFEARMTRARAVPLSRVRVTGEPLKHAFQAVADGRIAPVFGVRTVRASAAP